MRNTDPLASGCRSSNGQKVNTITHLAQGIIGIKFKGALEFLFSALPIVLEPMQNKGQRCVRLGQRVVERDGFSGRLQR